MCTNHIDKLDAAIKRPGRVNQVIYFDKMTGLSIRSYLEYNFPTKQLADEIIFKNKLLTPAQVEEVCIEHWDNFDEIIEKLST